MLQDLLAMITPVRDLGVHGFQRARVDRGGARGRAHGEELGALNAELRSSLTDGFPQNFGLAGAGLGEEGFHMPAVQSDANRDLDLGVGAEVSGDFQTMSREQRVIFNAKGCTG